jgi:hypothetical protein
MGEIVERPSSMMMPVRVIALPFSGRCDLATMGGAEFIDLPIPMPSSAMLWLDRNRRPVAAWAWFGTGEAAEQRRIRWQDLDVFVAGVGQFNRELAERGYQS